MKQLQQCENKWPVTINCIPLHVYRDVKQVPLWWTQALTRGPSLFQGNAATSTYSSENRQQASYMHRFPVLAIRAGHCRKAELMLEMVCKVQLIVKSPPGAIDRKVRSMTFVIATSIRIATLAMLIPVSSISIWLNCGRITRAI
ncbi:hypothetical protein EJ08DRAFT_520172 [Tothia fuscella]|uniref:Uncharacterized protein n=1 Tax=Tothia fuscella TaxID=1048955 RepID=A0A9P4NHD9_9PEZI|nr:hypothetical protein EJ08DRAFT_520172 [Tothia fuscella]